MKINVAETRQNKGFTLIEMIGVLAVIAILAAVLIPKVFEAINNSRINNSAMSCQSVKTAMADHYAKAGSFSAEATIYGTNIPVTLPQENYDLILLREGFMDKPFAAKIGDGITGTTGTRARAANIGATSPGLNWTLGTAVDATETTGFALSGGNTNVVVGSACLECVITGLNANDAKDLNDRIDGPTLGAAVGVADLAGRVKYAAPGTGSTTVYVYLTHR